MNCVSIEELVSTHIDETEDDDDDTVSEHDDPIFTSIQDQISAANSFSGSCSTIASDAAKEDEYVHHSENFTHVPYGFQPRKAYLHPNNYRDFIGLSYNGKMRQFIILDPKGVTLWNKDALTENAASERALQYPRYQYRLITNMTYARKYNVYFALGKDFALKVLNRDFHEICYVRSDLQSILFMIFNPVKDELITGGVTGTKIWSYQQVADEMWAEIKLMANYKLFLKYELKNVGGSWVKRVDLDLQQQHLYCCSDMDLYAYDMEGKLVFKFERAHAMSITGCVYSSAARQLLTVSADCYMKVWSLAGGLIHTFSGHARAISNVILHPEDAMLVLTSSLDGTVRLWSLDTMDCLYSHTVSSDGILWMGVTDDNFLYLSSLRTITIWSFNTSHSLWALARNRLTQIGLVPGEGKSTRVLAVGEDSSVRIFSRKSHKNLSTVLPPPILSPMEKAKCVVYNRVYSVVYMLLNSKQIWVYTTRTDPACRIAVWDVFGIQQEVALGITGDGETFHTPPVKSKIPNAKHNRATLHGTGKEGMAECLSLCYLNSPAVVWTEDEGLCCPVQHVYLLFGLSDGRILFMDPVVRAKKYFELRVNKDAVIDIRHDSVNNCLMTICDLSEAYQIQIWALPQLTLMHQVFTTTDICGYIRLNSTLVTAHKDGGVLCHELFYVEDVGHSTVRPRFDIEETSSTTSFNPMKVEHKGPVLSIDVCHKLDIFVTCSADGVIKVWRENKVLLTEIILAESLNSTCFFNERGDLLVGFKNHIFFIDSKKVCPSIERSDWREEDDEVESVVYEDPAIVYEGVLGDPDPIDLDNYLVPFDIEFSKDFLEGTKLLSPPKEDGATDDDAEGSELSCAPTETYLSPFDTPRRLSMLDLTLTREPSKYDLRKSMDNMQKRPLSSRFSFVSDEQEDEEKNGISFAFPRFGVSPGATPSPSTPSCMTPSDFDVSEGGESTDRTFTPIDSVSVTDFTPAQTVTAKTTKKPSVVKELEKQDKFIEPSPRMRLGSMRIDSKALQHGAGTLKKEGFAKIIEKDDHGHKNLIKRLEDERTREATKIRDERKEKKAGKVAEKRKKKLEEREKHVASKTQVKTALKVASASQPTKPEDVSSDRHVSESIAKQPEKKKTTSVVTADREKEFADNVINKLTSIGPKKKKEKDVQAPEQTAEQTTSKRIVAIPEPQLQTRVGVSPEPHSKRRASPRHTTIIGDTSLAEHGIEDRDPLADMYDDMRAHAQGRPGSSRPLSGVIKVGFKDRVKEGEEQADLHDSSLPRLETAVSGIGTDLEHGSVSGFGGPEGRSVSPTIYSDDGSEWTIPAPEEYARSRLEDFHADDHSSYIRRMRADMLGRPPTSMTYAARPNTPASGLDRARPHTALPQFSSQKQEFEFWFSEAVKHYKGMPGTEEYIEHLYDNSGTKFGETYHDKLIERYQLIRMQRSLRAQSAKEKRHILELRKREANKNSIGHKTCDKPILGQKTPDTTSQFLKEMIAANLPVSGPRTAIASPAFHPSIPQTRAKSARPATAKDRLLIKSSRPKTAPVASRSKSSTVSDGSASSMEHRRELSQQQPYRYSLGRAKSASAVGSPKKSRCIRSATSNAERTAAVTLRDRWKIRKERAEETEEKLPKSGFTEEDLKLIDPRNPISRLLKSHTKSIPSKCSHYVLVSRNRDPGYIVPTPIEEQLILDRFPEWQEKWIGPQLRFQKPPLVQKAFYAPEALR